MSIGPSLLVVFLFSAGFVSCAASKLNGSGSLSPSIYYKPTVHLDKTKCSASSLRELLSPGGRVLTTLCDSDYKQCLMQGSCFVQDENGVTSYNYHSTRDGVARFIVTDLKSCPYGYGVSRACLDPYFSVAADLGIYKLGDVIFIPRLVGVTMPSGEIHDGFLVIRDAGSSIVGAHRFDFFTGFLSHRNKENPMVRLGFGDPRKRFEFRKATPQEAQAARERRGFPGLRKSQIADLSE